MSISEYIFLTIIIASINFICFWLQGYVSKKARNQADKEDVRHITYESEKGKNFATKEDIEEITRKVEEVKNYVSLAAQKRYERLNEQEKILLEVLHVATQISQSQNKLLLYLHDTTTRKRFDTLVDFVNDHLTQLCHLCNMAMITVHVDGVEDKITSLVENSTFFGLQVCTVATNAANIVSQYTSQLDYALNKARLDVEIKKWLILANQTKQKIEELREKSIDGKEQLNESIEDYCLCLKQLYDKDIFVYKQSKSI